MASSNHYTLMNTTLLSFPHSPLRQQDKKIHLSFHHHLAQKNIISDFKKSELLYELVPLSQETQVFQGSSLGTDTQQTSWPKVQGEGTILPSVI